MFGPIKNVIFDFDGTLVNTMSSVIEGFRKIVEKYRHESPSDKALLATFGSSPFNVLSKWVKEEDHAAAFEDWKQHEIALKPESFSLFGGVSDLLRGLKDQGVNMGVFTGRDRLSFNKIAEYHDILKFFDKQAIVCGDDPIQPKPAPDAILHILKECGWSAENTLMVGDHPYDMQAAVAAGVKAAAALWDLPAKKTTHRARFKEVWQKWDAHKVDLRLESPLSLLRWLGDGNF